LSFGGLFWFPGEANPKRDQFILMKNGLIVFRPNTRVLCFLCGEKGLFLLFNPKSRISNPKSISGRSALILDFQGWYNFLESSTKSAVVIFSLSGLLKTRILNKWRLGQDTLSGI
jgi:hypothetical protein